MLVNPSTYDQANIEIDGYAVFGFEITALFRDKASSAISDSKNAVWIIPDDSITEAQRKEIEEMCNRKHIRVRGVVNVKEYGHGHLNAYKAEILVKYVEIL